jgi:hypothetical protein
MHGSPSQVPIAVPTTLGSDINESVCVASTCSMLREGMLFSWRVPLPVQAAIPTVSAPTAS